MTCPYETPEPLRRIIEHPRWDVRDITVRPIVISRADVSRLISYAIGLSRDEMSGVTLNAEAAWHALKEGLHARCTTYEDGDGPDDPIGYEGMGWEIELRWSSYGVAQQRA